MRNRHVVLYDLKYPSKYITPNGLRGHMTSDLKSTTMITPVFMCILSPTVSEAMVASKQPQRSDLTLKFNSVTSITYVTMLFWPLMATISRML